VKSKREKNIEAVESFEPSIEVAFSHGEGMSQMKSAIHIGIGEGLEIFRFFIGF
jgi:hypothetical protein